MYEAEIEMAVAWWAVQLRGPAKHDNGEPFQTMFANLVASETYTAVSDEQIDQFKSELSKRIRAEIEKRPPGFHLVLSTDYHPGLYLADALKMAGIEDDGGLRLPCKTVMWIEPGSVKLSAGYGAQAVELMEAKA